MDRTFVLLDGDSIFGPAHLAAGFMNAGRSIREGRCRAKQPSMEVLRFLGGSRQVSRGAKRVSPGKGAGSVLLAVAPSGWPAQEGPTPLPEIDVRDWDGPEVPGLEGRVVSFVGHYPFFQMNQLILAFHVEARGEITLNEELADFRVIAPSKLRPWPMGTGMAVRDWLERRSKSEGAKDNQ